MLSSFQHSIDSHQLTIYSSFLTFHHNCCVKIGSVVECMYTLQSFGIDSINVPISSSSGKLKTKQHAKWFEFRRLKEECLKQHGHKFDRIIECPKLTDILLGRGRPIMRHPGNTVLRNIVQMKLEEYDSAKSKKEKTVVTWDVLRTLKGKYGARFLNQENIANSGLGWVEVSNERAREKIRVAFRDLLAKIMKTNAAEMETNSTNDQEGIDGAIGSIVKVKRKVERASAIPIPSSTESSTVTEPHAQNSFQCFQECGTSTSVRLWMDDSAIKRQRRWF